MIHSKKTMLKLAALLTLSNSPFAQVETNIAWAGDAATCHFHGKKPASESTVKSCALKRVEKLIKAKKIPKEWSTTTTDQISLQVVEGKKGKEWKASLRNPKIVEDGKPKVLYIFFTHPGNFIAANFTGQ